MTNRAIFYLFVLAGIADYFFGTGVPEGTILALDPIITGSLITGGAALAGGLLGGKSKSVSQGPLETAEQRRVRWLLSQMLEGGTLSDMEFGGDIGLPMDPFAISPQEQMAISGVTERFGEGVPESLQASIDTALELMQDPTIDPAGTFAPFKTRVERELGERSDELKRQAAFMGDLYSTATVEGLGDVQARGQEVLSEQLAGLTSEALNRRMAAAELGGNLGQLLEAIERGRISDLLGVGGIERGLESQRIGQEREEVLRRRQEEMIPLDIASTILGTPTQFGVPSVSIPQPSPFQGVLDVAGQIGGQYIGSKMQERMLQNLFQPTVSSGGGGTGGYVPNLPMFSNSTYGVYGPRRS